MNVSRLIFGVSAIVLAIVSVSIPVFAEEYGGGSVTSYAADSPIDVGTIVQLTGNESNRVKVATDDELQNMFGVAVDVNQIPLTISNGDLQNETYVAVSGTYRVLVSTEGGPIASGDYVTLSSLNGIAMKASTEQETVFGRANGPFDGKGVVLGKTTLQDVNGNANKEVALGAVSVTIDIRRNPNEKSTEVAVPDFLRRLGLAIAEKEVNPIRIYLSVAITTISLITAIIVLYSGVRSSVISIGRNPMSKKSIFRALLEIILTSILILIVGLFAVYLLLRL